jgi:hypothetical protein
VEVVPLPIPADPAGARGLPVSRTEGFDPTPLTIFRSTLYPENWKFHVAWKARRDRLLPFVWERWHGWGRVSILIDLLTSARYFTDGGRRRLQELFRASSARRLNLGPDRVEFGAVGREEAEALVRDLLDLLRDPANTKRTRYVPGPDEVENTNWLSARAGGQP